MSDNAIEPAIKAPSPARIAAGRIICDDTQWGTVKKSSGQRGLLGDAGLEGANTGSWRGIGVGDDAESQKLATEIIKILNEAAGGELEKYCMCWYKTDSSIHNQKDAFKNPDNAKFATIIIRTKILKAARENIQGKSKEL